MGGSRCSALGLLGESIKAAVCKIVTWFLDRPEGTTPTVACYSLLTNQVPSFFLSIL